MKQDDRETIDDMLTSQEISHTEFSEKYFEWKAEEPTAIKDQEIDEEVDFLENPLRFEQGWTGRMSPFVKETIYTGVNYSHLLFNWDRSILLLL